MLSTIEAMQDLSVDLLNKRSAHTNLLSGNWSHDVLSASERMVALFLSEWRPFERAT